MSSYRKKPVVIEARQYDGSAASATPIINWALAENSTITFHCSDGGDCRSTRHKLRIPTLEGSMFADAGDWIIRGVQGEFYPCKPDIFAETYEPVES